MRRGDLFQRRGFTLIELLCVMAIIGILAGMLMSTMGNIHEKTDGAKCISNLRQIAAGIQAYVGEHDGEFPEIETNPNKPIYPAENQAKGLLATLTGKEAAEEKVFLAQLLSNPKTASLRGNGLTEDLVKCPSDMRMPAFNYYAKYGTSYEWAPFVDDELASAPQIFTKRGQMTVSTSKIVVCFDVERVHGLSGDFQSKKNYLYADGHVRNYWDTSPRTKPKN